MSQRADYLLLRSNRGSETNEAIGFGAVEKTTVVRTFNAEQQLERLARAFSPDPAGIDSIKTQWRYDLAGRQVAEVAPDLRVDSTVYDAASNAVTVVTRRYVASPPGGMPPVTTTYDALNRPQRRTIPAYSYPGVKKGIANLPSASTFNLDSTYGPYAIPAVVDTFTYTRDGLIQSANNRWASIARVYSVRGELEQETLDIMREDGTLGSPVSHRYLTKYAYDRNGRRIRLVLPSQFGPAGQDSIKYAYSAWGALEHVIDPSGTDFTYTYDARGAVIRTTFGTSGVSQFRTFDQDGRLRKDSVSNASSTWPRWPRTHLRRSFFTLDGRDLQLAQHDSAWYGERTLASYSGLGYLKDAYHAENGKTYGDIPGFSGTYYHVDRDTLTLDGLGNRRRAKNLWETGVNGPGTPVIADYTSSYFPGVGRLATMTASPQGTRTFSYDRAGNETFSSLDGLANCQASEDRTSFYDGLNRLVAEQRRWVTAACNLSNAFERSFEEYRYDALGRRVWVHGQRECDFVPAGYPEPAGDLALQCKLAFMRRTVWDGAQELVEIQAPGAPASVAVREQDVGYQAALPLDFRSPLPKDPNRYYGQVVYTTGLAVDQPLSVRRLSYADRPTTPSYTPWPSFTVIPIWDRQGTAKLGVFSDGAWAKPLTGGGTRCQGSDSAGRCVQWVWAEASSVYDLLRGWAPQSYMGSLLEQKRNASGTYYRRARVYDPAAGRFTQEDPIGLAGGLNLYGFANGDPVNFSDPFGLFECDKKTGQGCSAEYKRLLQEDKPLGDPGVADPLLLVGGLEARGAKVASRLVTGAAEALSKRVGKNSVEVAIEGGFKRIDLIGKAHGGVPTPHVHIYKLHTNPLTGAARYKKDFAGPATRQDIIDAARAAGIIR